MKDTKLLWIPSFTCDLFCSTLKLCEFIFWVSSSILKMTDCDFVFHISIFRYLYSLSINSVVWTVIYILYTCMYRIYIRIITSIHYWLSSLVLSLLFCEWSISPSVVCNSVVIFPCIFKTYFVQLVKFQKCTLHVARMMTLKEKIWGFLQISFLLNYFCSHKCFIKRIYIQYTFLKNELCS